MEMQINLRRGKTASGRTSYIAYYEDEDGQVELARIVDMGNQMWHIDMIVTNDRFWASTLEDAKCMIRDNA